MIRGEKVLIPSHLEQCRMSSGTYLLTIIHVHASDT